MAFARAMVSTATLALTLACTGCGLLSNTSDENGDTIPLDSRVMVTPWEALAPGSRTFILRCETEQIYGCSNFQLRFTIARSGPIITIKFTGVHQPQICLTSFGPATASINLGTLETGTYVIVLDAMGEKAAAPLVVSNESYALPESAGVWVVFSPATLQRVPEGLIWGQVGYPSTASDSVVQSYLDALEQLGAHPVSLSPGNFGHFQITDSGTIVLPSVASPIEIQHVYGFSGDVASLRDLVKRYGKAYDPQLYTLPYHISLNTWRGDAYYSWVLQREP